MGKKTFRPEKFTELVRFDWFIKYMFRDKADFEVLEGFLSELMGEDVIILEILESEANQKQKNDKFNRVDVMVKTAKGERIIVEVQNNNEYDYLQRILFGASKVIAENIKKGETYANVKKVVSVSIVYFNVGQGFDYVYHGTTIFKGIHSHEELLLTEEQKAAFGKLTAAQIFPEYYLINAASFIEKAEMDGLDEWVYFLKNSEVRENFNAKGIAKAKEKLSVAKLNKRKRSDYDHYLTSLHDEASWNETARLNVETARINEETARINEETARINEEAGKRNKALGEELALKKKQFEAKAVEFDAIKVDFDAKAAEFDAKKSEIEAKAAELAAREARIQAEKEQVKVQAILKALGKGIDENTIADLNDVPIEAVRLIKETLFLKGDL